MKNVLQKTIKIAVLGSLISPASLYAAASFSGEQGLNEGFVSATSCSEETPIDFSIYPALFEGDMGPDGVTTIQSKVRELFESGSFPKYIKLTPNRLNDIHKNADVLFTKGLAWLGRDFLIQELSLLNPWQFEGVVKHAKTLFCQTMDQIERAALVSALEEVKTQENFNLLIENSEKLFLPHSGAYRWLIIKELKWANTDTIRGVLETAHVFFTSDMNDCDRYNMVSWMRLNSREMNAAIAQYANRFFEPTKEGRYSELLRLKRDYRSPQAIIDYAQTLPVKFNFEDLMPAKPIVLDPNEGPTLVVVWNGGGSSMA